MTNNNSRSQPSSTQPELAFAAACMQPLSTPFYRKKNTISVLTPFLVGFVFVAIPMMAMAAGVPFVAPAAPTPSPTIAPSQAAPAAASSEPAAPVAPPPATTRAPGAGLPAPLVALLRTEGPYQANEVYSVVPTAALDAIEEQVPAPEWYAITRGRFVGVVDQ